MTLDIVMPFYGRADHFRIAVESVLHQSSPEWRLVIVDDACPDLEAGEWVSSIRDPRIAYLRNEETLGPSRNYQKCVGLMRAAFAVIMGCDDVMLPGYVKRIDELTAQFATASIIQPGVTVINEHGIAINPLADRVKSLYRPRGQHPLELRGEKLARSLLRGSWFYFPSLAWNVAQLRGREFRPDLNIVQDLAMLLELVGAGGSMVIDDEVVFCYRRHQASASAMTGADGSKFAQERAVYADAARELAQRGWRRAARAARWHVTSRLHAASALPSALLGGEPNARRLLIRHVMSNSTKR